MGGQGHGESAEALAEAEALRYEPPYKNHMRTI